MPYANYIIYDTTLPFYLSHPFHCFQCPNPFNLHLHLRSASPTMISDNNLEQQNQNSPTTTLSEQQPNNAFIHQEQTNQHQENEHNKKISSLTIELSSNIKDVNEDDEPTTPTSSDQRIPIIATCPPAPRKPRSVPMNNKRKTPSFSRISVDLMVMFNAICDPVEDDIDSSERVKKVKKMDVITGEL